MGSTMLYIILAELVLLPTQIAGYTIQDKYDAAEFLQRFGYMERKATNDSAFALVDLSDPLKEFQAMVGVKPTGILDEETIIFMNKPRCGNVDKDHANLKFKRVVDLNQPVDMNIDFFVLDHDDNNPFDGPGRTLAHAFLPGPRIGGDIHFDDAEEWTTESNMGHNLHFAAVHEIGHALGLYHSKERNSIMFPHYQSYTPNLRLDSSDITQIQKLYGPKENAVEPTQGSMATTKEVSSVSSAVPQARNRFTQSEGTTSVPEPRGRFLPQIIPTTTTSRPSVRHHKNICHDTQIDAITTLKDGNIYAFHGDSVYHLDGQGGGVIATVRINQLFPGLHQGIDAALTRSDGETLFFKGDKYWKFDGYSPVAGYPKEIFRHFPGIPNGIDAAFEHPRYGALYFFKGDSIWIHNVLPRKRLKDRPRSRKIRLSVAGIHEDSIDSAFVAPHGQIYLFSKNLYWRLDDRSLFTVAKAEPPYPRNTTLMWLNCYKFKAEGITSL